MGKIRSSVLDTLNFILMNGENRRYNGHIDDT